MIRRPKVNAKCFQHNLTARSPKNRGWKTVPGRAPFYPPRRRCRWCARWNWGGRLWVDAMSFPCLCHECAEYLLDMEPFAPWMSDERYQNGLERPS